ncbi:MAG: TRAP transporter small permease [Synergistaceae bacterium]|nr:TRAP transporter small permease [Synergistaceae bacterium]
MNLNAETAVSSLLLLAMVTLTFIGVFTRWVINYSLAFTEELTVYFFVWIVFLGSALAFRDNYHMRVTMFLGLFPKPVRMCLYIAINAVCILFFLVLGYFGLVQVFDEISIGIRTESMQMPIAIFTSAVPIGSLFVLFRVIGRLVMDIKENRCGTI